MKNKYLLILLFFFVFYYSCRKDESCQYRLDVFPKDTSLFVSYDIDGESFKYYQIWQGSSKTSYSVNDTFAFINLALPIGFDTLELPNSGIDHLHPYFHITFNKRFNKSIDKFKWPMAVTTLVKNNLNYSSILLDTEMNDSMYYEFVSITYKNFSTDNFFKYYSLVHDKKINS